MKRILILFSAFGLFAGLLSCTPEAMDTYLEPVACCGDEGNLPPPPPPPPPPPGGGDK